MPFQHEDVGANTIPKKIGILCTMEHKGTEENTFVITLQITGKLFEYAEQYAERFRCDC